LFLWLCQIVWFLYVHLLIQQIRIKHLLCFRCCAEVGDGVVNKASTTIAHKQLVVQKTANNWNLKQINKTNKAMSTMNKTFRS
jgi:hypothetical protein